MEEKYWEFPFISYMCFSPFFNALPYIESFKSRVSTIITHNLCSFLYSSISLSTTKSNSNTIKQTPFLLNSFLWLITPFFIIFIPIPRFHPSLKLRYFKNAPNFLCFTFQVIRLGFNWKEKKFVFLIIIGKLDNFRVYAISVVSDFWSYYVIESQFFCGFCIRG